MNDSFILRDRKWREQNERVTLSSYATFSGVHSEEIKKNLKILLELALKEIEIESFTQKLFVD